MQRKQLFENISFRLVRTEDFNFLYKLHVLSMKEYVNKTWGWNEEFQHDMFKKKFNPEELEIITLKKVDIGVIAIENKEEDVFLRTIELLPEYQRKGIGTYILNVIISSVARKNKPIFLYVLKVNPAKRLYERLGFEQISETTTHYVMKFENNLGEPVEELE